MVDPTTLIDGSARTTTYTTRLSRELLRRLRTDHRLVGPRSSSTWRCRSSPAITAPRGVDWKLGSVDFTSISAARWFHFDANNDQEQTRFPIARSGTLVDTRQVSQEFRLAGTATSTVDYQTGLYLFHIDTDTTSRNTYGQDAGAFFATDSQYRSLNTPTGRALLQASLRDVFSITNQKPDSDSAAAFGQLYWQATDRTKVTFGLRETWEWKTNETSRTTTLTNGSTLVPTGNATADAIRATQAGADFATVQGVKINDHALAWLVNPSYRVNEDILLYTSASAGEKSGAVAFDSNGRPANVEPEKTLNFEAGIKSYWWNRRATVNANIYYTRCATIRTSRAKPTPPRRPASARGSGTSPAFALAAWSSIRSSASRSICR